MNASQAAARGGLLNTDQFAAKLGQHFAGIDKRLLLAVIGSFVWQWFTENEGDTIIRRHILIFKVTIKVRDLKPIFVVLFGPQPTQIG